MAKRTSAKFRESQLLFTTFGRKIRDMAERTEGTTMNTRTSAAASRSTTTTPDPIAAADDPRLRDRRKEPPGRDQNGDSPSSSSMFVEAVVGRRL